MELNSNDDTYVITQDDRDAIRYAVIVGMQAVGEIERLRTVAGAKEALGKPWPEDAIPDHPTNEQETRSFARALVALGY